VNVLGLGGESSIPDPSGFSLRYNKYPASSIRNPIFVQSAFICSLQPSLENRLPALYTRKVLQKLTRIFRILMLRQSDGLFNHLKFIYLFYFWAKTTNLAYFLQDYI